jgi:ribonuclease P protein component
MIGKDRRLVEREIRKVLKYKKPFFSYSVIANVSANRNGFPRFAAIFSGKSVRCGVSRNFFRRRAYELARPYLGIETSTDVVIVPKKGRPLDHRDESAVNAFEADVSHLYAKIFSSPSPTGFSGTKR